MQKLITFWLTNGNKKTIEANAIFLVNEDEIEVDGVKRECREVQYRLPHNEVGWFRTFATHDEIVRKVNN